jgi:hypothetical protein
LFAYISADYFRKTFDHELDRTRPLLELGSSIVIAMQIFFLTIRRRAGHLSSRSLP